MPIPASALPPAAPCQPWNLTLVVDSNYTLVSGASVTQTSQQEVLPVRLATKCAVPAASTGAEPLQVRVGGCGWVGGAGTGGRGGGSRGGGRVQLQKEAGRAGGPHHRPCSRRFRQVTAAIQGVECKGEGALEWGC